MTVTPEVKLPAGWGPDLGHKHYLLNNMAIELNAANRASLGDKEPLHAGIQETLEWVRAQLVIQVRGGAEPDLASNLYVYSQEICDRVAALWRTPTDEQLAQQTELLRAEIAKLRPVMANDWPETRSPYASQRWAWLNRALSHRLKQAERSQ